MTTWCLDIKSNRSSNNSSGRLGVSATAAGRHSIAQILGLEAGRMATGSSPSDQHVKLDKMMVISDDQPLDLSLDKSKCRAAARLMPDTTTNRPTGIKRTPLEDDEEHGHPLSEEEEHHRRDDDEEEEEEEEDWAGHRHPDVLQPDHLQMAANFSTVLQYYLTAARLYQANEAMRSCHTSESHQRIGGDDSLSHSEAGNVSPGSDPAPTDPAFHQQPAKRRKKDLMIETAVTAASATLPAGHNNNNSNAAARPRKTRTTFTGKQLFELERIFEQKKYLSSNERQEVARLLSVTGSQIKIWFQNRRTKWKKQDPSTAAELAQLKSASRSQQQQQQSAAGPSSGKTSAKTVDSDEDEDGASASSAQAASPHPPV